jgi:hypothetical protein
MVCTDVVGIQAPHREETVTLTAFVNEACDHTTLHATHKVSDPMGYSSVENIQSITSYFSRPRLIGSVSYAATALGTLYTVSLDIADFFSTKLYNWTRVGGAFGFTADVVFTIAAASNPFQGGRLKMAFIPGPNNAGYSYNRLASIPAISQLPGVELDLAEKTSAVLTVPFIAPETFFALSTSATYPTLGTFLLAAYTGCALETGGTAPNIAIYTHLENFKLYGAAPASVVFQAGGESTMVPGTLSKALAMGSGIVSFIGNSIPLISSYTAPVSWLLRQSSRVAAALGFSKPLNFSAVTRMVPTSSTYQFNVDGADTYYTAGFFADNEVGLIPIAHSDVDEMSFAYIHSVYAAISLRTLSVSSSGVIHAVSLCPHSLWYNAGNNNTNINANSFAGTQNGIWPSGIFWLGSQFGVYRGSFKFRIKMSKTKMHTGRLLVGYFPFDYNTSGGPLFNQKTALPSDLTAYNFKSAIWDLREGNVFDFECPFFSQLSYLPVDVPYGTFFISVIEPLYGPPSVATSVPFLVEVAGCSDLEYAIPQANQWVPAPVTGTNIISQAGDKIMLGGSTTEQHALSCIGEKVQSVKQLLNVTCPIAYGTSGGSTELYTIRPWYTFVPPAWSSTTGALVDNSNPYSTYFSCAYSLGRGGTIVDCFSAGADPQSVTWACQSSWAGTPGGCNAPIATETGTGHFKFPFYSPTPRAWVAGDYLPYPSYSIAASGGSTSSDGLIVSMRAADDAQLGYYIGPPVLTWFPPNTGQQLKYQTVLGYV